MSSRARSNCSVRDNRIWALYRPRLDLSGFCPTVFGMTGIASGLDLPIQAFASAAIFRSWLRTHHKTSQGIWLRLYKKNSGVKTISYAEALDEALCYGWIDSQVKKFDADSFVQRFSPRRPRSIWSQRNISHIERLIAEKRMKPAGLLQIEQAKKDGRFAQAYAPPSEAVIPADLQKVIDANPKMKAFAATLNRSNINAIAFRLHTAKKPETRERRFRLIVDLLKQGKKLN